MQPGFCAHRTQQAEIFGTFFTPLDVDVVTTIDVDGTHVAAVKVGHIIEPKQPMVDSEA